jgi:hypothetical protein
MASTKIRLFMIVTLLSAFTALPMAANSALVNPITSGNGVTGGGNWTTGVSQGWSIADASDNYLYSYSFQAPSQGSVLSHFILETSRNFESNNLWGSSNGHKLKYFSPKGPGNSNPGLPGSLYGHKFGEFGSTVPDTVTNQDTVIQRISISEPGTLLLFGSGLLGITVWRRRRKRMQN